MAGYLTNAVKILIAINIGIFILINLTKQIDWLSIFGLVPRFVWARFMVWQLVTYMFLHLGLWHLAVNMLMLWWFGPAIERAWGSKQFLLYYFFTGIGAGMCSLITSLGSFRPVIGASGAIFGILVAYALMYPETVILLFLFFPMKIRYAVLVLAAINLLGAISAGQGDIAYFAHLGGGLFGYLYLKNEWIRLYLGRIFLSGEKVRKKEPETQDIDKAIDRILDKISQQGMQSLNPREKRILKSKSKGS